MLAWMLKDIHTEHTSTYMRRWTGGRLLSLPPLIFPSYPLVSLLPSWSAQNFLLFPSIPPPIFLPSPSCSPSSRTFTSPSRHSSPISFLPCPPPHTCCWNTSLHVFSFTSDDIKQKLYWTHIFVLIYCIVNPTWNIW